MGKSTLVRARLTIFGEFDPDELSECIGVTPTSSWRSGDPFGHSRTRRRHDDGWLLATQREESCAAEKQLDKVMKILNPKLDAIAEFVRHKHLGVEVACDIHVYDTMPSIHLDRTLLSSIVRLGAEVDVDITYLGAK